MKKKSDKKTVIILLVVLAMVTIVSGIWTYQNFKQLDNPSDLFSDTGSDVRVEYVFEIKDKAIKNIEDFLDVDFAQGTIWKDLYDDNQFNSLKELNVDIDIETNIGNPNPFVSTSTEGGMENKK